MHIVVTGASSGIGRDIAKRFADKGTKLSLVARRKALLDSLCAELEGESQGIEADLANDPDPIAWLKRAEERFGPTDILVNNAGVSYVEPVQGIETERVRAIFQVNVHVPIAATHHVLPAMLERKSGTIVNIASNAAFSPAPYFCHYTATKGALGNFSEGLRMELKGTGVHVVTVYPGPIHTPMGDRNWKQLEETSSSKLAPIGDTVTLARLVDQAVSEKHARVIYPRFYMLSWYLPSIGRIVAEYLVPKAVGTETPPI